MSGAGIMTARLFQGLFLSVVTPDPWVVYYAEQGVSDMMAMLPHAAFRVVWITRSTRPRNL